MGIGETRSPSFSGQVGKGVLGELLQRHGFDINEAVLDPRIRKPSTVVEILDEWQNI